MKVYGIGRSRAMRTVWLLREIGQSFETVGVVQPYNQISSDQVTTRDPAFLAVNPNGHIPTIEDDGFVWWESMAINLYLADAYGGELGPRTVQERALMTMWSFWVTNECEAAALILVEHAHDPAKVATASAALEAPFTVLDGALISGYLVGGRFTVADINVAMVLFYARNTPGLLARFPRIQAWFSELTGRPAYRAALAEREACVVPG